MTDDLKAMADEPKAVDFEAEVITGACFYHQTGKFETVGGDCDQNESPLELTQRLRYRWALLCGGSSPPQSNTITLAPLSTKYSLKPEPKRIFASKRPFPKDLVSPSIPRDIDLIRLTIAIRVLPFRISCRQ
jgi:hypothetical protein